MKILNRNLFLLAAFSGLTLSSCLKDKGFEDGEYNAITNKTEGQEFVSIPTSSRPGNTLISGIESKSIRQEIKVFALSYDAADVASEDFTATVELNNSLLRTSADTLLLPSSSYTIKSTTLNFKKGDRISDSLTLLMPNTSTLDPTKIYTLGFTLTSVSKAGVEIPANLKNLIVLFTVKNKYDGIYDIRSHMMHPADRPAAWLRTPFDYPFEMEVVTTGPLSVEVINTAFGAGFHPLMVPGASGFGQTWVGFEFDETDKLIAVTNLTPGGSLGRDFQINNGAGINNRYDPATKKIYAAFFMTQSGFAPIPIYDTLTFTKAR